MKNRIMGEFDGYEFKYSLNPTNEEKLRAAKKGLQGIQNARQKLNKGSSCLKQIERQYIDYIEQYEKNNNL